tara:strand:- start:10554 stop:10877 length:324 start_codon:yes stop_codon:yes gene_type:complete
MKKLKFNKSINEIKKESMEKLNAKNEMLHILKTIWTSRTKEQISACENMLKTYTKKHGENNIGITFIEVELERQKRLNGLFAKMGQVQNALQKENAQKKIDNTSPLN